MARRSKALSEEKKLQKSRLLAQLKAQDRFRELRGKVSWEGDLEESRRSRVFPEIDTKR
jgi:hypothetical protein